MEKACFMVSDESHDDKEHFGSRVYGMHEAEGVSTFERGEPSRSACG